MGWGRWLLFGDLGQQMDLADQRAEMDTLRRQLRSKHKASASVAQGLEELRRDNDELKLVPRGDAPPSGGEGNRDGGRDQG
jgi:hypothetical protein